MLQTLFSHSSAAPIMRSVPLKPQRKILTTPTACKVIKRYKCDTLSTIADFIKSKIGCPPEILIICGSGLGTLCTTIKDSTTLNYKDIPNFPVSTVEGHQGKLVFGTLSDAQVVCMQGRFHYYEGYSLQETTIPVKALALVGTKTLIVSNAAGGINQCYNIGDIMFIKDHLNFLGFAGNNPLRGPNDKRFGPRFFPVNKAYNKDLRRKAMALIKKMGLADSSHEGVYAMLGGPNFETIAEVNMLRVVGADAVGMSTVPEVLVAKHCGMAVLGFSIISNKAIASYEDENEPNHKEVLDTISAKSEKLMEFVTELVKNMGSSGK